MNPGNLVIVFPISAAFGLRADWFENVAPRLIHPSYLLMTLLLVAAIGIMALNRFEDAAFDKKLWNIPVLLIIMFFWPALVIGLKNLIDTFNTFLVYDIFRIRWTGFGFPNAGTMPGMLALPVEGLARFLPNLAYWVVYAFFMIFFFFYAVLGPLVLAKGVLFDEMETFLQLVKELTNLLLWQTTLIVVVAFILPDIVSGAPFPSHPQTNYYFLSIILGIMIFFVPSLTRKFATHMESAFVPLGFRWSGSMIGLAAATKVAGGALSFAGLPIHGEHVKAMRDSMLKAEEFRTRYQNRKKIQDLTDTKVDLMTKVEHDEKEEKKTGEEVAGRLFDFSKKAKEEIENEEERS